MKTLITFLILFFSTYAFAESYECTHELSRFDRPGEYETKIYKRNGNVFLLDDTYELFIAKDTEAILMLILVNIDHNLFFTTIINKTTKEFTENFTNIEDAKETESAGLVYGKCKILKS